MMKVLAPLLLLASMTFMSTIAHPMDDFQSWGSASGSGVSRPASQNTEQHGLYQRLINEEEAIPVERKSKDPRTKLVAWFHDYRRETRPLLLEMLKNYLHVLQCEELHDDAISRGGSQGLASKYKRTEEFQRAMAGTILHAATIEQMAKSAAYMTKDIGVVKDRRDAELLEMSTYKKDLANAVKWASEPFSYKAEQFFDWRSRMTREKFDHELTKKQVTLVQSLIAYYQAQE